MLTSVAIPGPAAESDLSRYLKRIRAFPLLWREEEYDLATRWRDNADREAAHRLATSHLRLVVRIARKYRGYGLPMADLISEGNLGLMHAVRRFDPDRGVRLSTYAMYWIRAAVLDFILRSWSLVPIGSAALQKRLFFKLRQAKARLNVLGAGELSPEQSSALADALNAPQDDVVEADRRLSAGDVSLNAATETESGRTEMIETLAAAVPTPEEEAAAHEEEMRRHELMMHVLEALPPRDRDILVERRLRDRPRTLAKLSETYGVSRERIRQIEERAFGKVRAMVLDTVPRHAAPI